MRWDVGVERSLLRELGVAWDQENGERFWSRLQRPVLELSDGARQLGLWQRGSRTIALSRQLLELHPWPAVLDVLRHEMAHQYVDEVLRVHDESAHGPAFRQVCDEFGVDGSAAGDPQQSPALERVRRKISALLALATSDNRHEAEAAMRKAQRMMLQYNLDQAALVGPARYGWRVVGEAMARTPAHVKLVAGLLSRFFFVQVVRTPAYMVEAQRWGRVYEIMGTPENLELAAYVYDFVLNAAESLWQQHRRQHGIRGNRDRRAFLRGVVMGFSQKLSLQQRENIVAGLVWVGDPKLSVYVDRRFPRLVSGPRLRFSGGAAYAQGRAAGERLTLNRGVSAKGSGGGQITQRDA